MRSVVIFVLILLVLSLSACKDGKAPDSETEEVNAALLEKQVVWLNQRLAEENWEMATTGASDSLAAFGSLYDHVLGRRAVIRHLQQWARQGQDELLRRNAQLILPLALQTYVDSDRQIQMVRDSLLNRLYSYRPFFEGEPRSRGYLTGRMMQDSDRSKRELAYRSLMTVGTETSEMMARLFRLRNQASRGLGYNNYFDMVRNSSSFTTDDFRSLLDTLDALTAQPYRKYSDQVRRQYATASIEIWDLPYQYASAYVPLETLFPADSVIRFLGRAFVDIGFDIEALPIYVAEVDDQLSWAAPAVSMQRSSPIDQRVAVKPASGLRALEQTAEVIGRAVASSHINQRGQIYGSLGDKAWQHATEKIFAGILGEGEVFLKEAHVPENLRSGFRAAMKAKNLIDLRIWLVRLKFEYEAYQNPNRDLNQLYWSIFEDYLYLPRHDDLRPWGTVPEYVTGPGESHQFVLGDLIAWQTLAFLDETTGRNRTGEEGRAFLIQNYFRFGSRFDWQELLERGTGEKLRPEYLLGFIPN